MKKILLIPICLAMFFTADAQLPDGNIAPDFTFTDINGVTRNLYSYLDSGKTVVLDVFTTWCAPCWNYRNTHVLDSLYLMHDIPGDRQWKILEIEADGGTDSADLHGTGSSTEGDWVTGALPAICNPSSGIPLNDFKTSYNIVYYPTFYVICPNKKVYSDTLNAPIKPSVITWEYVAAESCAPSRIVRAAPQDAVRLYPDPAHDHVTISFTTTDATTMTLTLRDMVGRQLLRQRATYGSGSQKWDINISNLPAGTYIVTLCDGKDFCLKQKLLVN